jgi:Fis family transcriptional regulator
MSTIELLPNQVTIHSTEHFVSLSSCITDSILRYLTQLQGQPINNVYGLVLAEIEEPLLQIIMPFCNQNQSKAAITLGLSRGTLRKKLSRYGMLITK